jgi:hypothetical protein
MKKVLSVLMLFVLILSLAGCFSTPKETAQIPSQETSAQSTIESSAEPDLPEIVVYDENGITITALRLETSFLGIDLIFRIENNTNVPITVQMRNSSINGYMIDSIMSCDVAVGKKALDDATFMTSYLEGIDVYTINDIEDVEFYLTILDSNTFRTICETDIIKLQLA